LKLTTHQGKECVQFYNHSTICLDNNINSSFETAEGQRRINSHCLPRSRPGQL